MLHDVTNGSYTNHPIKIHPSYGKWNAYIPKSEDEFKEIGRKIASAFDESKIGIRISSVNAALKYIGSNTTRVSFESAVDEWVAAYWELYRQRFINVGYCLDDKSIKQFFARPTEVRNQKLN